VGGAARCLSENLERAVEALCRGGVVALPTDTCYGLAGDALREDTVMRVLRVKGRSGKRPPAVFVPDLDAGSRLGVLTRDARAMATDILPGSYTLLLPAHAETPRWLISPEGLVGIRWTDFPTVATLLDATGLLLTATSANRTGAPPPYDVTALAEAIPLGQVDWVIDSNCGGLPPSTVIDFGTEPPTIRRSASAGPPGVA
jgi:L-threonylcarbamoyladenylate synthase